MRLKNLDPNYISAHTVWSQYMEKVLFNFLVKENSEAFAHIIDVGYLQKKLTFCYKSFLGIGIGDLSL